MPSASSYIDRKTNVPSQARSREWDAVDAQLRERAFFMASVSQAKTLNQFRHVASKVASGAMGPAEAREALRRALETSGYHAEPGLEGAIKDLSSLQRQKASLDTNVALAQGWALRQESLGDVMHPAWELFRAGSARRPRDWPAIWNEKAQQVNWEGVARNGRMIALVTSPIWERLSRFGHPYPPFDYNSHMRTRLVDLGACMDIGLVDNPKALRERMRRARQSFNEGVEEPVKDWPPDLLEAVQEELKGLVERVGDSLVMTDPNGTKPYPPGKIGEVISAPLPEGIPHLQEEAFRQWIADSRAFAPRGAGGGATPVSLDMKEDMARLINRIEPVQKNGESDRSAETLMRGLQHGSEAARDELLELIKKNGYGARPGYLAESWTPSARTANEFSSSPAPMVLVCGKYKSRKRIDGIYRYVDDSEPSPHKPKRVEGESLFGGDVRFRHIRHEMKGDTLYVYVEEIK